MLWMGQRPFGEATSHSLPRWSTVAPRSHRWLGLASTLAVVFSVVGLSASAASADPTPDPLANPNCYTTAGCGNNTSVPGLFSSPPPYAALGALPYALPTLGVGLVEDPVVWLVPGLQQIALAGSLSLLSYEVGSSIYHHWFQGHVTDTVTDSHCNSWGWEVFLGDPFSTGIANGTYLHARCGVSNTDTFAGSPHNSPTTEGQWWSFWTYVVLSPGIVHGALKTVPATYCHGKSPCYAREAQLADVLNLTGPFSTQPQGTSVSAGWADPSTGAGVTTRANPFGSPPTSPTAECLQGGVIVPCSGVSPDPWPVGPAQGLPPGWPSYANADANYFRCQLSPSTFGCPAVGQDNSDWATTGGPLITMPDCAGMTVAGCEALVDAALAAAGSSTTAAFTTTYAPTYNPALPDGVVTATIAAAGAIANASSVTAEINEESPPRACAGKIENYHKSKHSSESAYMLGVFYVFDCNFFSPPEVLLRAKAWACTSEPSQDQAAIEGGAWGCVLDAESAGDQTVTANGMRPGSEAFLDGEPYDPTKWYIATTFSNYADPYVKQGWTQAIPPGTFGG
jgi:hypothetical protein